MSSTKGGSHGHHEHHEQHQHQKHHDQKCQDPCKPVPQCQDQKPKCPTPECKPVQQCQDKTPKCPKPDPCLPCPPEPCQTQQKGCKK